MSEIHPIIDVLPVEHSSSRLGTDSQAGYRSSAQGRPTSSAASDSSGGAKAQTRAPGSFLGAMAQMAVGVGLMAIGVPMLILPGPGLLTIGVGALLVARGFSKLRLR